MRFILGGESVFQWIKNITYYLIFVSLLSHLMPAGKYEQYMKLFFGAVFILIVAAPLTRGLHLDGRLAQAYEQIRFTQEQGEFEQKLWGMEEERISRMIKQYEEAVGMDVRAMAEDEGFYCLSAGARIEEREGEEKFGQVVEIVMVIGSGESEEGRGWDGEKKPEDSERKNGDADEIGEENKDGKTVSIDPVQIVIDRGNNGGIPDKDVEKIGEKVPDKDGKEENEGAQNSTGEKTQKAAEEFKRKVARYYGLEEEAVRITWKDD